jgi:hypothetical protein
LKLFFSAHKPQLFFGSLGLGHKGSFPLGLVPTLSSLDGVTFGMPFSFIVENPNRVTLVGFSLSLFDQRTIVSYLVNVEKEEPSVYQMNTFVDVCAHPLMY